MLRKKLTSFEKSQLFYTPSAPPYDNSGSVFDHSSSLLSKKKFQSHFLRPTSPRETARSNLNDHLSAAPPILGCSKLALVQITTARHFLATSTPSVIFRRPSEVITPINCLLVSGWRALGRRLPLPSSQWGERSASALANQHAAPPNLTARFGAPLLCHRSTSSLQCWKRLPVATCLASRDG